MGCRLTSWCKECQRFCDHLKSPKLGLFGKEGVLSFWAEEKKRDQAGCMDCLGIAVKLSFWHRHLNARSTLNIISLSVNHITQWIRLVLLMSVVTEDEMAGWHHWLDGRESEWTPGVGDGQGGLACCSSWGCKESDRTERLNWTELMVTLTFKEVLRSFILKLLFLSLKGMFYLFWLWNGE